MTKIHPLALGVKLDGAMDALISARLSALQFLTPHDLNVGFYARDDTVLALAQVGRGRVAELATMARSEIENVSRKARWDNLLNTLAFVVVVFVEGCRHELPSHRFCSCHLPACLPQACFSDSGVGTASRLCSAGGVTPPWRSCHRL